MPTPFDLDAFDLGDAETLRQLVERIPDMAALRFEEDELLVEQGEASLHGYLVLKGAIAIEQARTKEEAPTPVAFLDATPERPCFVGEMAHLGGGPRSARARATFPTFALRVPPEGFDAIVSELPEMTRILCRQLAERLREANRALQELSSLLHVEGERRQLEAGEVLVQAGAPADRLFQLVFGEVEAEGGPVSRIGDFLDPEPYLCGGTHPATLRASEPCFLVAIPAQSREGLVRRHPELVLELLASRPIGPR